MRTVVHLSDLHFGRTDPATLAPLAVAVQDLSPDLIAISGDLTQRAKESEFEAARLFLETLPFPLLIVPGNHDVPLWNPFRRFIRPFARYRRAISTNLEPVFRDEEITVVGVNTARAFSFKNGRINRRQLRAISATLDSAGDTIKIIVTHHPFDIPAGGREGDIVGKAHRAMTLLATQHVDIFLAGHLHKHLAAHTYDRYRIPGYAALVVQSGTSTSTRHRGETNSFNVLHIDGPKIILERHTWDPVAVHFAVDLRRIFLRGDQGWAEHTKKHESDG